jgi:hypothetical protein
MRVAFLTEMEISGKIEADHPNMRTEFAWMHAMNADHYNIYDYPHTKDYDAVFVIFPKGRVYLDACGSRLLNNPNPVSGLLASNIVELLKGSNKKVFYVQEGPHWLWNDYELVDQIGFYNLLASCDGIFAHNESDTRYYKGLIGSVPVYTIPTLMIDSIVSNIKPTKQDKVIVGGNFARWYGGFESFIVAQEFRVPIWGQTSHARRDGEDQIINHLPRVFWTDWMKQLSEFKYAVHLMPTVAAGTFSLNCAYFGIPCIGNEKVDTQRLCHSDLAIDVADLDRARYLAKKLVTDKDFYTHCSENAKEAYIKNYNIDLFKQKISSILSV